MQEPTAEQEAAAEKVFMAYGILNGVYYLGRLAHFYEAGREVKVGWVGWHCITKEEARADWPKYIQAASLAEVATFINPCSCLLCVSCS